jgi:hypothetical protein
MPDLEQNDDIYRILARRSFQLHSLLTQLSSTATSDELFCSMFVPCAYLAWFVSFLFAPQLMCSSMFRGLQARNCS